MCTYTRILCSQHYTGQQGQGSGTKSWWRERPRTGAVSLTEVKVIMKKYHLCVPWLVLYGTCNLEKYTTHYNKDYRHMRGLFFFQEGVEIQDETDWFFFFYNFITILLW